MHSSTIWRLQAVRYRVLCLLILLAVAGCGQPNQATTAGTTQTAAVAAVPATQSAATTVATEPAAVPVASTLTAITATTTAISATASASTVATAAPAASQTATQAAAATPGPGEFANPVIDQDFADPGALKVGDTYYAYATNFGSTNVQVARSKDLVHWEMLNDALPILPAWASPNNTWAPEVMALADGKSYVMYFTARDTTSNKQCVGVAYVDGRFCYHAWPEVWVGGDTWIALEPTWGAPFADATHIKLAEGEITDIFAVAQDLGKYQIKVLEAR